MSSVVASAVKQAPGAVINVDVQAKGNNLVDVLGGASKVESVTVNIKSVTVDAAKAAKSYGNNSQNTIEAEKRNEAQAKQLLSTLANNVNSVDVKLGRITVTNVGAEKQNFSLDFLGSDFRISKNSYAVNLNLSKQGINDLVNKALVEAKKYAQGNPGMLAQIPDTAPTLKMSGHTITVNMRGKTYTVTAKPARNGEAVEYGLNGETSVQSLGAGPGQPHGTVNNISFNEVGGNYAVSVAGNIRGVSGNFWRYALQSSQGVTPNSSGHQ